MTEQDIRLIEKELDIVLPERYKILALQAPLKNTQYENAFYDDPQKIIRTNLRLRKNGIYGSAPLKNDHFVVGFIYNEYRWIDLSSDADFYHIAGKSKTWHYEPDNPEHGTMHMPLSGHIDQFLFFHQSDVKREQASTQPRQKATAEEAYAFLASLWEDKRKKDELRENKKE